MIAAVADTHAALWYLFKNSRLLERARHFIDEAARAGDEIGLSPISLAEIVYLTEKNRLQVSAYEELKTALGTADYVLKEVPFNSAVVDAMGSIARSDVPDLPDRIVAASAVFLHVPVISRDGRIRAANIQTIW